jgi:hypothetical protein
LDRVVYHAGSAAGGKDEMNNWQSAIALTFTIAAAVVLLDWWVRDKLMRRTTEYKGYTIFAQEKKDGNFYYEITGGELKVPIKDGQGEESVKRSVAAGKDFVDENLA